MIYDSFDVKLYVSQEVKVEVRFFSSAMQLLQHLLLKRLSFLHLPLSKIN